MRNILLAICFALTVIPAYASQATIDNPRIVLHKNKHMAQIKWYQYAYPRLIVAFKITNSRQSGSPVCTDVDWAEFITRTEGFKYCYDLSTLQPTKDQWITVIDKHWHTKDQYYIIQYELTSHNAPYGPFIPR